MPITDWPLTERPREKLINKGAACLSKAELLAIFLQTGTRGKTAMDLAQELLAKFKTLTALLNATENEVSACLGIGRAKFCLLQATLELGRRQMEEKLQEQTAITSGKFVKEYLIAKLSHEKQEIFACIFLNSKHQIIKYEALFHGTLTSTPIYPRVIAQKALEYNAGAVIFAHNHPSGNTQPSEQDIYSTRNLISILTLFDVRVLDHIIVGANMCISLAEEGLL